MTWCLVSAATGRHLELLNITRPGLEAYAERHHYDLCIDTHSMDGELPPSWYKVPLLQRLLTEYEGVLWVDADAAFADISIDVRRVARGEWNWVVHRLPEGDIPNCGVLALRNTEGVHKFLEVIWLMRDCYGQHPWWEQAAAMELLGTNPGFPPEIPIWHHSTRTPWEHLVRELPPSWNHLPDRSPDLERVTIVHASGPHMPWSEKVRILTSATRLTLGALRRYNALRNDEEAGHGE